MVFLKDKLKGANMKDADYKENTCPICKEPNNCQIGSGKCWCFTEAINDNIKRNVATYCNKHLIDDETCICKSCIEKFRMGVLF